MTDQLNAALAAAPGSRKGKAMSDISMPIEAFLAPPTIRRHIDGPVLRWAGNMHWLSRLERVQITLGLETAYTLADKKWRRAARAEQAERERDEWKTCADEIESLRADRDNSNNLLDECRRERNFLQKTCATRADALDAATARAEQAERERDEALKHAEFHFKNMLGHAQDKDAALAEVARMREALAFYANPEIYRPDSVGRIGDLTFAARAALKKDQTDGKL